MTDRCVDDNSDGYLKYSTAMGCPDPERDCYDYHAGTYPGAAEIPVNAIDENCNGSDDE